MNSYFFKLQLQQSTLCQMSRDNDLGPEDDLVYLRNV